jgi:hypothetical protein
MRQGAQVSFNIKGVAIGSDCPGRLLTKAEDHRI